MKRFLLICGALLCILPSRAVSIHGLNYDLNNTDMTASVSENSGFSGDLVIPETIEYNGETYSVTSIGNLAFQGCSGLTSVEIPNSVTSIGKEAFEYCSGLTSVEISDIGAWCGISFGDITANPLYYAHNLYLNGELVTNLEIPTSVTSIGSYAFAGCSGMTSMVIPASVTSIGSYAFAGCSGLTSVEIPNSVTSIGDSAFWYCSGLTSVEIPNSVTEIGSYAFRDCSGLTSVVIPTSVTSIGDYAFSGCSGLTSVEIPITVTTIGDNAFYRCSGLTSVEIPNSVTSIGSFAFAGCSGLTSVVIPASVTLIGLGAFYGCSGLTSVEIPNSVTEIGSYAFRDCSGLTSVEIPNSVTLIGDYAFSGCSGLTSVEIPNSVTSIGGYTFSNCGGLNTVTFNSNNVLSLGQSAFSGCFDIEIITCNTQRAPVADNFDVFENDVYSKAKLYVPEDQKNLYYTIIPWSKFQNIYSSDYNPGETENGYKIVPVLLPSQTLMLGVKNMDTGMLENSFSWNSSDELVADVDSQGIVTAKAVGETVIIATNSEGKSAEFEILVIEDDDNLAVQEILLESKMNNNVYTLGGVVVIRDATQEDLRTLAPGLYIIGGKKVIVK